MKYKIIATVLMVSFLSVPCLTQIQVSDSGKLYPAQVCQVVYPATIKELQAIVKRASIENKKLSIAGARYSQGGQSNATNSINIDLTCFNKLVNLDLYRKTVTVQSGMTWEQLQNILHPYGLSVKVMQSSNVFSIGGSASVNVHGRDVRYGPMIETINSCTIINASGEIQTLSRCQDAELFSLVIGGYGLFEIIVEIELSLAENVFCYKEQEVVPYKKYVAHFKQDILKHPDINLYYGRFVMIPGKKFLKDIISTSYIADETIDYKRNIEPLQPEESIVWNQALFNLYRKHPGKLVAWVRYIAETYFDAPWETGTFTSRNQLMRPYVHSLENKDPQSTDLLQEYFIPIAQFTQFTDQLRRWSEFYDINLLNVTLRWVPKNRESFLSYARSDSIAFVLYFTTDLDAKSLDVIKKYTKKLTDACLHCYGTFYLPYQQFATSQAVHRSYPMMHDFIKNKKLYDRQEIFTSNWYQNYVLSL